MKQALDKVAQYITDDVRIGAYLFLLIFVTRIFLDLVIEKIFGLGEEWQHYMFSFYKHNYVVILGYMFIYEVFYLYRYHRFHFTKIQWIGILYAFVAIIATYACLKGKLAYEYFTKLSLGEMIMTSVFMFDVGRKLNTQSFEKLLELCSKYYLLLTFLINTASLIVLVFNYKENIVLLGRTITIPSHYDSPASLLGASPYTGFYYNTSITGPCCSLGIFLLVWFFRTKRINIFTGSLLSLINLYCLFLSENRTGVIGLIVFFFLMANTYISEHIKSKTSKMAINLFLITIIVSLIINMLFRKIGQAYVIDNILEEPFEVIDSLSSKRLRILISVLDIFKKRPLLGNGWNSVITVIKHGTVYNYPYAHNIFLGALAWTGGIGFVIMGYYFYHVIKNLILIIKRKPKYRLHSYLALSLIAQCQFENGIFGDWNHAYTYLFWLIIGFLSFVNNPS